MIGRLDSSNETTLAWCTQCAWFHLAVGYHHAADGKAELELHRETHTLERRTTVQQQRRDRSKS